MPAQAAPALKLMGLTKTYPSVRALDDLSMAVMPGEVRALIGKNGAGKSTAIKILSGALMPDAGTIEVAGRRVSITGPQSALKLGVATVYQEISLVPALTVAENILLGRWRRSDRLPFIISTAKGWQFARAILDRLRIDIDPGSRVEELNVAQQQLVEIAKAVSYDPKVLVLDEPTSALPAEEIELVHDVVRTLSEIGTATIYVTHRLHEIPRIAHFVTVLRDGRQVGTIPVAQATPARITELMVGKDWKGMGFERRSVEGPPLLEVHNLSTSKLRDVSFVLREGEVLGLAGLLSAGRTELLRAIFGLDPITAGEVVVAGQKVHKPDPALMKSLGVALTPENRKKDGLVLDFAVKTNATMAPIDRVSRFGWLNHARIGVLAREMVGRLAIKTPSVDVSARTLSGGNQQKVVIANWLNTRPKIILMDEPSRGIDVAAKQQIFELVRKLAREGIGVLFVSSEIEEVLDVCDRILVIHEGALTADLSHNAVSLDELIARTMNA
jgi:ABC-type sugar transport system ATPase subunit